MSNRYDSSIEDVYLHLAVSVFWNGVEDRLIGGQLLLVEDVWEPGKTDSSSWLRFELKALCSYSLSVDKLVVQ